MTDVNRMVEALAAQYLDVAKAPKARTRSWNLCSYCYYFLGGGLCRTHGGGKKCKVPGCTKGTQRLGLCYLHGGIRRCSSPGCVKKDRGNGFCIAHGKRHETQQPTHNRFVEQAQEDCTSSMHVNHQRSNLHPEEMSFIGHTGVDTYILC